MCGTYKYWSKKEDKLLIDRSYGSLNMKQRQDLAWEMGRTLSSLQNRWYKGRTPKVISKPIEAPVPITVDSNLIDVLIAKATKATIELDANQVTIYF